MQKLSQLGEGAQATGGLEAKIRAKAQAAAQKALTEIAKEKKRTARKVAKLAKRKSPQSKKTNLATGFGIAAAVTLIGGMALLAGCGPTQTQQTASSSPTSGYEEKETPSSTTKKPEKETPAPTVSSMPENTPEPSEPGNIGIDDGWTDEPAGDSGVSDNSQHEIPNSNGSTIPEGGNNFTESEMATLQKHFEELDTELKGYCKNCPTEEMEIHIRAAEEAYWEYVTTTKGLNINSDSLNQADNFAFGAQREFH